MKQIIYIIITVLILVGCTQYENMFATPKNYSSSTETNITTNTTINQTNETIEEIKTYDDLAIYMKTNSIIIKFNNKSLLIDGGSEEDSQSLLQNLRNLGIEELDYLIITNTNKKRIEGIPYIILRTNPKKVFDSGVRNENTKIYESVYNKSEMVMFDDFFIIDDLMVYLLVPYDDGLGLRDNEDSNSIVVRLFYDEFSIVFMSDCDYDCEERISSYDAKVLVASENCESTSLLFLQKINPEMVIMPKPCENIEKRINNLNIPLKRKVTIVSDGESYEVK